MKYYLRSEIAKMADINIETLRYYENKGLIPIPKRSSNGYRLYSKEILIILDFIKNAKKAGFTLEQIKNLFSAVDGKNVDLNYLDEFIDKKLMEINQKIVDLQNVKGTLEDIKNNLYKPHECPLINAFNTIWEN